MSSIRLLGWYDGEKFVAAEQDRVDMLAPASDPIGGLGMIGFWLELRDSGGKPLYRQVIRDPFAAHVEVFGEPKSGEPPISMMPRQEVKGYLVLLVPDEPEGSSVALVRSTYDGETKGLKVVDVAQIPLEPKEKQ